MPVKKGFAQIALVIAILLVAVSIVGSFYIGKNSNFVKVQSETANSNPTEEELLSASSGQSNDDQFLPDEPVLGATSIQTSNNLPTSGYSRQKVTTDRGMFTISLVAADLNSARVIVDTASDSTCHNNCPVLSLKDYISRNGAFAGINGTYFCPATYSSCAGKTNSFDTLLMNKKKYYFNSDNNVYSTVPAVIFSGNSARYINQSLEWGRDTGIDSVIANYPLLVKDGNLIFTGSGDGKLNGKGNRAFIATKDNYVYIGVVSGATVADSAKVLHTMGIKNALNLDSGGSTALWSGGYKFGPGRGIPNAVLLVRK